MLGYTYLDAQHNLQYVHLVGCGGILWALPIHPFDARNTKFEWRGHFGRSRLHLCSHLAAKTRIKKLIFSLFISKNYEFGVSLLQEVLV